MDMQRVWSKKSSPKHGDSHQIIDTYILKSYLDAALTFLPTEIEYKEEI